jgi:hypothetical protein
MVEAPQGFCTLNFMFTDGTNRYMGTAGHCAVNGGEHVWPSAGPVALDGDGNRIGQFVYAVLEDPKDFALIRLDSTVEASAQMCHFGGPTGLNSALTGSPVLLHHYGNGLAIGSLVPARSAVALGMPDPDHVFANGAAIFGDSGSGVISSDGGAVGVLVTIGVHLASLGTDGVDAGVVGITRIGPQIARAGQLLGTGFSLVTAPLL